MLLLLIPSQRCTRKLISQIDRYVVHALHSHADAGSALSSLSMRMLTYHCDSPQTLDVSYLFATPQDV
jgi:hypothetical protein